MTRLIVPATTCLILFWVGGNVLSAGLQISKAHADRLAYQMCEVTSDCR